MALTHTHHAHENSTASNHTRAFAIGIALNIGFVLVEWISGVYAQSLALIADASHNLGDVLSLLLAWGAAYLATRKPSARFTYGLRSSTILAALTNAMLLLVVSGGIAWEAWLRLHSPHAVNSQVVIAVAIVGIVINTSTALLFRAGRNSDMNIRGAYLHMAIDALVSVGVVAAGIGMRLTGWAWLDIVTSLIIVVVIFAGTWGLLRDALHLALHAVPKGVEISALREFLQSRPGVCEVHDLHVWGMSTTENALTAHLVMPDGHPGDDYLAELAHCIEHDFSIHHTTLQVETGAASKPCALAPDHVV
jgi:cobalt-zinc-cadmium efflux system protein